jgi:separase
MSAAITLQREILEVVQQKFPNPNLQDDLQWPLMTPNGSVLHSLKRKSKARVMSSGPYDDEDSLETRSDIALKRYWDRIGNKYRSQISDATNLAMSHIDILPANWTVISMSLTEEHNTLFVTRQRPGKEPLIFCIPLKERRENAEEDDEYLGFDAAIFELKEIIRLSDEGTRQAQHVKDDRGARMKWWTDRTALDERMKSLLENIEFCWLGAFKVRVTAIIIVSTDKYLAEDNLE